MAPIQTTSKVARVTVYTDRTCIQRDAVVDIPSEGEHVVAFVELPPNLDKDSLQVTGVGEAATLRAVQWKKKPYEADTTELDKQIKEVQEELTKLRNERQAINTRRKLVSDVVKNASTPRPGKNGQELFDADLPTIKKTVEFQKKEREALNAAEDDVEERRSAAQRKLDELEGQRNRTLHPGQLKEEAHISLDVHTTGKLSISITYLVRGASWSPVYDLRVTAEDKSVELSYAGLVQQSTGEDWTDVIVGLSTARPQNNGQQPDLSPWRLTGRQREARRSFREQAGGSLARFAKSSAAPGGRGGAMNQMFEDEEGDEEEESSLRSVQVESAEIVGSVGATSFFFTIPGKHNIPSRHGEPVRVPIKTERLKAHFRYSTVPKLAALAYLKAKVLNSTQFPLLAGPANVFLDGAFVAETFLEYAAPGADFWVFLGADEGVMVKHTFVNKTTREEGGLMGMSSKKRKVTFESRINVTNRKHVPAEVVVWDQIPISENSDIQVKLLEPTVDKVRVKQNENNYLEWFLALAPGQAEELKLSFVVEYPADQPITGL